MLSNPLTLQTIWNKSPNGAGQIHQRSHDWQVCAALLAFIIKCLSLVLNFACFDLLSQLNILLSVENCAKSTFNLLSVIIYL